jgi:Holliday junction DNA helicase RuvA
MAAGNIPAPRTAAILAAMFESIRGRLVSRSPAHAVVEAGGLGYAVSVPLSTYERLPQKGDEVTLRLHLVVREDEWRLYGFADEEERALFRACLKVSGVGPATALALLSGMAPRDLRAAVSGGDVVALQRVKGVGKKTAERLVVELKDALGSAPRAAGGVPAGPLSDAAAALVALGLTEGEAAERLRRVPQAADLPLAEVVRKALRG